jgi:hypothetical protein
MVEARMLFLSLIALGIQASSAQDESSGPEGLGIGLVVGEPTGFTFGIRPNVWELVQGYVSWSLIDERARFGVDWVQTLGIIETNSDVTFPIGIGLGGVVAVNEPNAAIGGRIPFDLWMHVDPLELYIEGAPILWLAPETVAGVEGALGGRIYF